MNGGVSVFDVSSPDSPRYKSSVSDRTVYNIALGDGVLCATDYDSTAPSDRVLIMDLSDLDSPAVLSSLVLGGEDIYPNTLRLRGNYLFYGSWDDGGLQSDTGIRVIDFSSRNAPFQIQHINLGVADPWALDVSGELVCVVEDNRFVAYTLK